MDWKNPTPADSRFAEFSNEELEAIRDGLLGEAELAETEEPDIAARVALATSLLDEIAVILSYQA